MGTVKLLSDEELSPEAREIFAEIRAKRGTDYINNFWRALAHDPAQLRAVWGRLQQVMGPGVLDPVVKEMLYIAVSAANNCGYCLHSHTGAAKAKGMTPEMQAELFAIIAMASQTNALATAMQIETDSCFLS